MAISPDRIRQLYQQNLGRPPSDDEINNWVNGSYGDNPETQIPQSGEANDYRAAHPGAVASTPPPQAAPGPSGPAPGPAPAPQGGGPGAVSRPDPYGGSPYGGPIFQGMPYTGPVFGGSPYTGPVYKGTPFTGTPYQAPTFKAPSGASYSGSPQLNVSAGMRPQGGGFGQMGMVSGGTPATPASAGGMARQGPGGAEFSPSGMAGGYTPATPATTSPAGSAAPQFGAAGGPSAGIMLRQGTGDGSSPGPSQMGMITSGTPGAAPGDASGQPPQVLNNELDPGYLARFQMGADALQNSAAAKGSILSGGTQKALDRYAQDYASNEYGNVYNRALGTAAFNAQQGQQGYENQFQQAAFNAGQGQLGFQNELGVAGFNAGQNQLGFQNQFGVGQFNAGQGQLGFQNQFGVGQFNAGQNQLGYQNRYGQYSDYMNWLNQAANRGLAGSQDLYSSPPM